MRKSLLGASIAVMVAFSPHVQAQHSQVMFYEDQGGDCTAILPADALISIADNLLSMGSEESKVMAANCLMVAAYKGDAKAQLRLAEMYNNGIGVPFSDAHAYKWAQIAFANGLEAGRELWSKIEKNMNVNDMMVAREEIRNFLEFERKAFERTNNVESILHNESILGEVSPEQRSEIKKMKDNIERMFSIDRLNLNNFGATGVRSESFSSNPRYSSPVPSDDDDFGFSPPVMTEENEYVSYEKIPYEEISPSEKARMGGVVTSSPSSPRAAFGTPSTVETPASVQAPEVDRAKNIMRGIDFNNAPEPVYMQPSVIF